MKTFISLLILGLVLVGLAYFIYGRVDTTTDSVASETATTTIEQPATNTVETFVRNNISSLSPDKEVVGGTFYVTDFQAQGGKGVVSYEDGHVAFTADFTYTVDQNGNVNITSFQVRK